MYPIGNAPALYEAAAIYQCLHYSPDVFFLPYNIEIFSVIKDALRFLRSARLPPLKTKGQKHEKENHRVQTKSRQTESDPPTVSLRSDLVAQLVAAYLLGRRAGI